MEAIPKIFKNSVFHVGKMDASKKSRFSHEGKCLSVSECPDEWRKIARGQVEGGLFLLEKSNSVFLDFHLSLTSCLSEMEEYGVGCGYLEWKKIFTVEYFDDELGDVLSSSFMSMETAKMEAEDGLPIKVMEKLVMTEALAQKAGFATSKDGNSEICFTMDALAVALSEDLGFDGVWWNDYLDPLRYSAPRGGILPHKLPEWDVSPVSPRTR